jgi:hypothetical protein
MTILKLDYKKAYDTVHGTSCLPLWRNWGCLWMSSTWLNCYFIPRNPLSSSTMNTEPFSIQCRICQRCLLAPYLFLLVQESLNVAAKAAMAVGDFAGILLSNQHSRQLFLQYANDTTIMIKGTEHGPNNLVSFLNLFKLASGLTINWDKSTIN